MIIVIITTTVVSAISDGQQAARAPFLSLLYLSKRKTIKSYDVSVWETLLIDISH